MTTLDYYHDTVTSVEGRLLGFISNKYFDILNKYPVLSRYIRTKETILIKNLSKTSVLNHRIVIAYKYDLFITNTINYVHTYDTTSTAISFMDVNHIYILLTED